VCRRFSNKKKYSKKPIILKTNIGPRSLLLRNYQTPFIYAHTCKRDLCVKPMTHDCKLCEEFRRLFCLKKGSVHFLRWYSGILTTYTVTKYKTNVLFLSVAFTQVPKKSDIHVLESNRN
jgi:hypothetical protein